MFKAYQSLLPENFQNIFLPAINGRHNVRRINNFKCNYIRTRKDQLYLSTAVVKLWNSLVNSLKECENLKIFKNMYKVKQFLTVNAY